MKTWVWNWPVLKWSNNSPRLLNDDQLASTAWKCATLTFSFLFLFVFLLLLTGLVWDGVWPGQKVRKSLIQIRKLTAKGLTGAVSLTMNTFSPDTPSNWLFLPLHLCDMYLHLRTMSSQKGVTVPDEFLSFTCHCANIHKELLWT